MRIFIQRIVFILFNLVLISQSSNILDFVYIDHINCTFNSKYCDAKSFCKLIFMTRQTKALSFSCNVHTPLDDIWVRVRLYYRFRNGYKKFLMDVTTDTCAYLRKDMNSALYDIIRKTADKYSNVFQPCPQSGHLWIKNYPINGSILPKMFFPSGSYYVSVDNKANGTEVLNVKVYFVIPSGKTIEDDSMG